MPTFCDYRNDYSNFIDDKLKFKEHLKNASDAKLIKLKHIIAASIMLLSILLGLIFATKDIFIISAIVKLFGQHTFNRVTLAAFIFGGLFISLGVSSLFDRHINKFTKKFKTGVAKLPFLAEKVSELLLIPLIFGIRDLLSNDSFFDIEERSNYDKTAETKKFTEAYIKRLFYFMTNEYGYTDTFSREKIEEYFKMDLEELSQKLSKLDFNLPVYKGKHIIKYDLSFLKKDLRKNFIQITGPSGISGTALSIDESQSILINEELRKIIKTIDGKIKKKSHLRESIFSKVKKNKSHMNNPVTKNIDNQAEQDKRKKIIEITD